MPETIFLCGDVMTGRGVDQILPHPCAPAIYEQFMTSALDYVALAERAHGPVPRGVDPAYVWGASLDELRRVGPAVRIVNLETSITRSDKPWPKGINYRMSPENAECLRAAGIDCCVVANNHVLDWGRDGLGDTLSALERLGIKSAGAGRDLAEARRPAIFDVRDGCVIVWACAVSTSGVPAAWGADNDHSGVNVLPDLSETTLEMVAADLARFRRPGDALVVSIHWGANWGYEVGDDEQRFAHGLIEKGGVSIVHGHSSHHPKAIEVYRGGLILYGCGDFLNDYEGIGGHERYRSDLVLGYFPTIDLTSGEVKELEMTPFRLQRFRLERCSAADARWLHGVLARESAKFDTAIELTADRRFALATRR